MNYGLCWLAIFDRSTDVFTFHRFKSDEAENVFTCLLLGHSLWIFCRSHLIGWCRWCKLLTPNLSPSSIETCSSLFLPLNVSLSPHLRHKFIPNSIHTPLSLMSFLWFLCHHSALTVNYTLTSTCVRTHLQTCPYAGIHVTDHIHMNWS